MKHLFKTALTSERHRKIGCCDKSDFGSIELIEMEKAEKQLIVSFKNYKDETEFIKLGNMIYQKINKGYRFGHLSREEDESWAAKQGRFTPQSAIKLCLTLRERYETSYSNVSSTSFILIGRHLYESYCPKKYLAITVASNLLFSCWLSIDIESHQGKTNIPLSKKNLETTIERERKRFNKAKPINGQKGDGHVSFSYPKCVKWGEDYQ